MRNTGIEIIGDAPWGTHFCLFHRAPGDLVDVLVPYFKAGLEAREACMWITSPELTTAQAEAALRRAVPDLDQYLDTEQLVILSHAQWYFQGGTLDLKRVLQGWSQRHDAALARGLEGLRLSGDTAWLDQKDWTDFAAYERAINGTLGGRNMLALCTYDLKRCGAAEVLDVVRNHQFALILNGPTWEIIESSDARRARQALRETQERLAWLASFPELNPNPVMEVDVATGGIVYANEATHRLMPELDRLGLEHPWLAGIGPVEAQLARDMSTMTRREVKIGEKWYQQNISPVPQSRRLRIYAADISERIAAEAEVAQSRRRIATILDSIADGCYALDGAWRFVHVNDAALTYFGMSREALLGRTLWEIFPQIDDSAFETEFRRAMTSGEPVHFVQRSLITPDKIVEMDAYPGADNLTVLFHDVTERHRREVEMQRLNRTLTALSHSDRAMMRATDEPSYLGEICRIVTEVCGHAMVWIGFAEDDANKTVRPVANSGFEQGYLDTLRITWGDSERGHGPTGTAIRTGEPAACRNMLTDPQFEPWRDEALRRGYGSSLALPLNADGKTLGALTIYSRRPDAFSEEEISLLSRLADDLAWGITALRLRAAHARAETELVELNRTLEKRIAERTFQLDRLNADLERRAHQLRALAQELTEAEERERRRIADILHDDLQQLLVGAKLHLSLLPGRLANKASFRELLVQITDMLDESIGKSRGMAHELSPPLLRQQGLVATLEWLGRQMKSKYGLEVRLAATPDAESSDALKVFLFRAAQEMLFNVVKHAGVGEAEIGLEQNDGLVRLTVTDDGKGFAAPSGTLTNWGAGGFGLFSIQERANMLGGRLRVESAPGRGCRLILEIPLENGGPQANQTPAPATTAGSALAEATAAAGGEEPLRVLLVDDHQVMRQGLAAMLLNEADIVVVGEADDGRQAVDMVTRCRPDVVIMDVSMPIMDGIEATRRIKREWPELRVIGLSMFEEEDLAEAMVKAGAESYLSKALGLRELVDVIRKGRPATKQTAAGAS